MKSLGIIAVLWVCSCLAYAEDCRIYTEEQEAILTLAYEVGSPHDLGLTLAAIVQQESFVGPYIVRDNPKDFSEDKASGKRVYGSYGVTHILLKTGMWLEGETNVWRAKEQIATQLVIDDYYALKMGLRKLLKVSGKARNWRHHVSMYNGSGPMAEAYADKIAKHVTQFRKCGTLAKLKDTQEQEVHKFGVETEEELVYKDWYPVVDCRKLWL